MIRLSDLAASSDGFDLKARELHDFANDSPINRTRLSEEVRLQLDYETPSGNDSGLSRMSPSSYKTPINYAYSPGSTEPTSMPSDKCSSRGPSEDKCAEGAFVSSEITDNERSVSDGSISPVVHPDNQDKRKRSFSMQNIEATINSVLGENLADDSKPTNASETRSVPVTHHQQTSGANISIINDKPMSYHPPWYGQSEYTEQFTSVEPTQMPPSFSNEQHISHSYPRTPSVVLEPSISSHSAPYAHFQSINSQQYPVINRRVPASNHVVSYRRDSGYSSNTSLPPYSVSLSPSNFLQNYHSPRNLRATAPYPIQIREALVRSPSASPSMHPNPHDPPQAQMQHQKSWPGYPLQRDVCHDVSQRRGHFPSNEHSLSPYYSHSMGAYYPTRRPQCGSLNQPEQDWVHQPTAYDPRQSTQFKLQPTTDPQSGLHSQTVPGGMHCAGYGVRSTVPTCTPLTGPEKNSQMNPILYPLPSVDLYPQSISSCGMKDIRVSQHQPTPVNYPRSSVHSKQPHNCLVGNVAQCSIPANCGTKDRSVRAGFPMGHADYLVSRVSEIHNNFGPPKSISTPRRTEFSSPNSVVAPNPTVVPVASKAFSGRKRTSKGEGTARNKRRKTDITAQSQDTNSAVPSVCTQKETPGLVKEPTAPVKLSTNSSQSQQSIVENMLEALRQDNVNQYLHESRLVTSPNLLPPAPTPRFIRPVTEPDGLPSRLLPNQELDAETVTKYWGRKYKCPPFALRPIRSLPDDEKADEEVDSRNDAILLDDFLRVCVSNTSLMDEAMKRGAATVGVLDRLRGRNYLTDILDKAINRGFQTPVNQINDPSPSSREDLLPMLGGNEQGPKSGRITPPLHHRKRKTLSRHTPDVTKDQAMSNSPQIYAEEVISLAVLRASDPNPTCRQCAMQIFPVEGDKHDSSAFVTLGNDKQVRFCSHSCLERFRTSPAKQTAGSTTSICYGPLTNSLQTVPIILHQGGPGKPAKGMLKRYTAYDKSRRSKLEASSSSTLGQNGFPAGMLNLPPRSWRGSRWLHYSAAAMVSGRKPALYREMSDEASLKFLRKKGFALSFEKLSNPAMFASPSASAIWNSNGTRRRKRPESSDNVTRKDNRFDDQQIIHDTRVCRLCHTTGDARPDVAGRLLNCDADTWFHVNCALWCYEAFETVSGCLVDVQGWLEKAERTICHRCHEAGARLPCFQPQCPVVYHLPCAHQAGCSFHANRSMYCPDHRSEADGSAILDNLTVRRRVYIDRNEDDLIGKVIIDSDQAERGEVGDESKPSTTHPKLRIGSLTLHHIGQLLPDQLMSGRFHTPSFIFPVGYSVSRLYWSFRRLSRRCWYQCCVEERPIDPELDSLDIKPIRSSCRTRPWFVISTTEQGGMREQFESGDCNGVWQKVLDRIDRARRASSSGCLKIFPKHLRGEVLYGLSEPHIVRVIESLPGVEHLSSYVFKFGRMQLISEMPLAVNPTGCARSEPKMSTHVRRKPNTDDKGGCNHLLVRNPAMPLASHTSTSPDPCVPAGFSSPMGLSKNPSSTGSSSMAQSKTQQYRRLRTEWKTNVLLARSRIQGLGLFAARDIDKHAFIIEYLGETIRNEVANHRERLYEAQHRGIYMFRADDDCIVDASLCGGLARYVNHSCEPNCIAEVVNFDNGNHIIIIANQKVGKGEELTYDYKFDIEEERWDRIPCLCGARTCRKWMN